MRIKRPTWEEIFMYNAIVAGIRSSCLKRPVGAVLVKGKRIIASGYNGAPPNVSSCIDNNECYYERLALDNSHGNDRVFSILREEHKIFCQAVHAEKNAVNQCSLHGISAEGTDLYSTTIPCPGCVRDVIIPNRIAKVKIWKSYLRNMMLKHDEYSISMSWLNQAKIPVEKVDLSDDRIKEIHSLVFLVGSRLDYVFNQNLNPTQ